MIKAFPVLYSRTSLGQVQVWKMTVEGNSFYSTEGILGGKLTSATPTVCEGKNIGRSNETSPETQALKEGEARWKKKKKQHYFENINDIDTQLFVEPMLAENIRIMKKKIFNGL